MNALWIFLGGGLGSLARWGFAGYIARQFGDAFPWGTLIVNVSGSFLIGFFSASTQPEARWPAPPSARLFFMTGVCGGYTTFSSFSMQTLILAREGEWFRAGANAVLSLALCLLAVWLGHLAGSALRPARG